MTNKISNDAPSYRVGEALRASPKGLARLPNIYNLERYQLFMREPLEQFLQTIQPSQSYFWATHSGAEIDLFFLHQGHRYGVEVKYNEAPPVTKSMRIALDNLNLDKMWIIYPGKHVYPVDDKISVCPLDHISDLKL